MIRTRTDARASLVVSSLAIVATSVALAILSANVGYGVTQRREATCDGRIPMPVSIFVLGWSAIVLALLALVLITAVWQRRDGGAPLTRAAPSAGGVIILATLVAATLAIALDAYLLYTVYQDAPLQRFVCSG